MQTTSIKRLLLLPCGLAGIILVIGLFSSGFAQQPDTLWYEDFEDDNWTDRWNVDAGTWEVGVPESGPGSAYTGERLAATNLTGNYAEPVDSRLIRHVRFEVPAAEDNPRLRFWHWYSFSDYDWGIVQIRVDDGEWEDISNSYYWYCSNVWTRPCLDLSVYDGSNVQIAFYFHSRREGLSADVSSGWFIDDIVLITGDTEFNNPEDWESGLGDWYVDLGTWEVGSPTGAAGPDTAYAGFRCAATVLNGSYSEPADARLISPYFTVPPSDSFPRLTFWHWYSFSDLDYGQVQIRVGDNDWVNLSIQYENTSGDSWIPPSLPLADYADSTVQLAFYFYSRREGLSADVSTGWYIDDIRITGMPPGSAPFDESLLPTAFTLYQNYPNPFNSSTTIMYQLPAVSDVSLSILDVAGREVASLVGGRMEAGRHQVVWNGAGVPSGVYICRLTAGEYVRHQKLALVR